MRTFRKYGSDNTPYNYAKRNFVWSQFDALGYMLKKGLINRELLFERWKYGIMYLLGEV